MSDARLDDLVARLPHHPPMRLVEHVVEFVPGRQARTTRRTRPGDWYFDGHFPGRPIVPAVALVELIAQTGGLAAVGGEGAGTLQLRVAAFNNLKFPAAAGPNALLECTAQVITRFGGLIKVEGRVTADGTLVAAGDVTLAETPTGAP